FLSFTTELWFLHLPAFSNDPYWSLAYEAWYYTAFATALYLRGPWRWLVPAAIAVLAGPRLWLLFPVWLMGCAIHSAHQREAPGPGLAGLLFGLSLAALALIVATDFDERLAEWALLAVPSLWAGLRLSRWFVGDWLTGALVAVNLYAARFLSFGLKRVARPIEMAAAGSFTLYLTHLPLSNFWKGHFDLAPLPLMLAVLASAALMARLGEARKDRVKSWMLAVSAYGVARLGAPRTRL
ncbi:MAG: hypothetical protein K2Q10_09045, partial [Rhodospirillales bacterium]|nr:hypothetical protein [Rhodospirillales bacterium]